MRCKTSCSPRKPVSRKARGVQEISSTRPSHLCTCACHSINGCTVFTTWQCKRGCLQGTSHHLDARGMCASQRRLGAPLLPGNVHGQLFSAAGVTRSKGPARQFSMPPREPVCVRHEPHSLRTG